LKWLVSSAYLRAGVFFCWLTTPLLVSLITFTVYVETGHILTPQIAFTALALFNILRFPINVLPQTISQLVDARNSVARISKYLLSQELDPTAVHQTSNKESSVAVQITDGEFEWLEGQERPTLKNLNITAERGKLIAIVGNVGSGKSSLLSALLGDIRKLKGSVEVHGTIAYVPQQVNTLLLLLSFLSILLPLLSLTPSCILALDSKRYCERQHSFWCAL
jgi:ATP-binding cassette subfamily C (CFTR/MRP) protein 1